jgi:isoamylase
MELSKGAPFPLGATPEEGRTNVAVSSEIAEAVEVCLFDRDGVEERVELPERSAHVWHGFLPDIGPGQRYGIRVHGPWEPAAGWRCNPAKLLLDPHATAIDGEVRWDEAVFGHRFDDPGVSNEADSAAFMPRGVITASDFDRSGDAHPTVPLDETIVYETHVKGVTQRHPRCPTTFAAPTPVWPHPAVVGYLSDLGVTAVELLPVHQFVQDSHLLRVQRSRWRV